MTEVKRNNYVALLDSVLHTEIHELLKKYKDEHKEIIKLSGNKSDLINNLLNAIESGIITEIELQSLIKDSEEFGDQYIYLFEPINNTVINRYNKGNILIDSIIHPSVRERFPKLKLTPSSFEWADFRFPYRGISNTWLIKMYDKKTKDVKTDDNFDNITGKRVITYERVESRLIYLVEWNNRNQLEIKISRTSFDSTKSLRTAMKLIRTNIYNGGSGIDTQAEVYPLDLTNCINNILRASAENENIYKLLFVSFLDSEFGKASIRCYDDQGDSDLLSEVSRKKAIEAYLEGEGKADGITIKFLADGSNNEINSDISVILGKDAVNKIIIPAKIKPQEYNYVRRKIAEFS